MITTTPLSIDPLHIGYISDNKVYSFPSYYYPLLFLGRHHYWYVELIDLKNDFKLFCPDRADVLYEKLSEFFTPVAFAKSSNDHARNIEFDKHKKLDLLYCDAIGNISVISRSYIRTFISEWYKKILPLLSDDIILINVNFFTQADILQMLHGVNVELSDYLLKKNIGERYTEIPLCLT